MILGAIYIPRMATHPHRLDLLGMALSAVGMFAFVFALQEGESFHWAPGVWAMMAAGLAVLGVFVWWQSVNRGEQLLTRRCRYRVNGLLRDLHWFAHDVLHAIGAGFLADEGGIDAGTDRDRERDLGASDRLAC
ncbi:Probable drug resistance transporter, EmrB/QacA subfamily [Mycobacteroides abscessus subsp. massiliense]|nr:Probable drug resistance transporter, EmrB/QacA subfamily [Mycobacteroides abscessus subsp. massiliense]